MDIFSLNKTQKQQVIKQTYRYVSLANSRLQINLPKIDIRFDLKGRSSGMFVVSRDNVYIRYNEMVFAKFFEDVLVSTVAHEVAHYAVHDIWGIRNVKPHGNEWKQVMVVFNVPAEVTSKFDVSDLPLNRQHQHTYACDCTSHKLSTTRHNRVQNKKAVYKCKKCKQPLKWNIAVIESETIE